MDDEDRFRRNSRILLAVGIVMLVAAMLLTEWLKRSGASSGMRLLGNGVGALSIVPIAVGVFRLLVGPRD